MAGLFFGKVINTVKTKKQPETFFLFVFWEIEMPKWTCFFHFPIDPMIIFWGEEIL